MKKTSLWMLALLCLLLAACGGKGGESKDGAEADSTATANLVAGPLAGITDFLEKEAFILIDKDAVSPVRYQDLPGIEEEAIKEVGLDHVNSLVRTVPGEELPAEIDDDNFKGNVVITKVERIKRDWLITFGIKFADGKRTDHAYLVYCDSEGKPLLCKKAKTKAKKAILHEQYIYQLKDPNMKKDRLVSYRIWKYVRKVKVVGKEDFDKYVEEARVRSLSLQADIEKELIERDLAKDGGKQAATENGVATGALAALDLQGPVSECKWKKRYDTQTYSFNEAGKLTAVNGTAAQKYFQEVKYDAKGRLQSTQHENTEYYTFENTDYKYDADGRVKAIDYGDGEGYTNSTFKRDAKGLITSSSYEDMHADMGDEEAEPVKGTITYKYTATDDHGNWTSRTCTDNGESWTETRTIKYY